MHFRRDFARIDALGKTLSHAASKVYDNAAVITYIARNLNKTITYDKASDRPGIGAIAESPGVLIAATT